MSSSMRAKDGREAAVLVLLQIEKGESPKEAEGAVLSASSLSGVDVSFLTELVNGSLERLLTIDFCIGKFSKTPVKKLKPFIRADLRAAVFQILWLDRVPESAAVNEAVKLSASHGLSGLKGFVNGVLRTIAKNRASLLAEIETSKDPEIRYSMPGLVYESLSSDYGKEKADSICASFFERKPLYALALGSMVSNADDSADLGKPGAETEAANEPDRGFEDLLSSLRKQGYEAIADAAVPGAFYIDGPAGGITDTEEFKSGAFYIMDRASMEDGLALRQALPDLFQSDSDSAGNGAAEGLRILDLCAAPGGKSIHAAQILRDWGAAGERRRNAVPAVPVRALARFPGCDTGGANRAGLPGSERRRNAVPAVPVHAAVSARDVSETKVSRIRENVSRCGLSDVITAEVGDATEFNSNDVSAYNVVIADVPCSGFGVIGNKPDIRYRHSKDSLQSLLALQEKILANAVQYVAPGGYLIFSTCTLHRAENEENRRRIEDAGFTLVMEKTDFPDEGHGGGFYTAILKRGREHACD